MSRIGCVASAAATDKMTDDETELLSGNSGGVGVSTHSTSSRRRRAAARKPASQQPAGRAEYIAPSPGAGVHPPLPLGGDAPSRPDEGRMSRPLEYRASAPGGAETASAPVRDEAGRGAFGGGRAEDAAGRGGTRGWRPRAALIQEDEQPILGRAAAALPREDFSWRERDWSASSLLTRLRFLPALLAAVVIVAIAAGVAYAVASRASTDARSQLSVPAGTVSPAGGGTVIQPITGGGTPTPAVQPYTIGTWVSNPAPPTAGAVTVFVRVSQNAGSASVGPAPGVPVTISVDFPTGSSVQGPVSTDADGLVSFTVSYGGLPSERPVFITASALSPGGQTISAETTFVPH